MNPIALSRLLGLKLLVLLWSFVLPLQSAPAGKHVELRKPADFILKLTRGLKKQLSFMRCFALHFFKLYYNSSLSGPVPKASFTVDCAFCVAAEGKKQGNGSKRSSIAFDACARGVAEVFNNIFGSGCKSS